MSFTIKCSKCGNSLEFINLGGTWGNGLKFEVQNEVLSLKCEKDNCNNKILIK